MNRVHRIRRSLAVLAGLTGLTGLTGSLLALAGAAPAFARVLPPPGGSDPSSAPAPVQVIVQGGMPGWQITLIALGAALVAAVAAVVVARAWLTRRVTATAS